MASAGTLVIGEAIYVSYNSVWPVSYTHLDVYKRQKKGRAEHFEGDDVGEYDDA